MNVYIDHTLSKICINNLSQKEFVLSSHCLRQAKWEKETLFVLLNTFKKLFKTTVKKSTRRAEENEAEREELGGKRNVRKVSIFSAHKAGISRKSSLHEWALVLFCLLQAIANLTQS